MNALTLDYAQLQRHVAEHPYPLLFATISGAHLYGFPSADSDVDLRGVHILPLNEVIGLRDGRETVEKTGIDEAIEMDLVTHDVRKFMKLMLKRNGYVLEQLLSPLVVHTTSEHEELKKLATRCITRHHAHHYKGFANGQWRLLQKDTATTGKPPRVKPLLYVLRVLLTGIQLMSTGEIEANLQQLNEHFRLSYVDDLIARKTQGCEKELLSSSDMEFYEREYDRLFNLLVEEAEQSHLPETATAEPALSQLLVHIRLSHRSF